MRWLVEVTSLGGTEKESLLVDADSWQSALQAARAQRGEADGISGFSIDVLNEGCRAVDPASRVSYDVRKAPEGANPGSLRPPAVAPRPQPPTASKIVFKREQDRSQALPLTYREYVYLAPPGTTEAAADALLRGQLERIRTSLANVPAGKLVNLAVFDKPFEGKATSPPIATLEWKDWRDAETVAFPRQATAYTAPTVPPAPTEPTPVVNVQPAAGLPSTSSTPSEPAPPIQPTPVANVQPTPVVNVQPAPAAASFGIPQSDPFAEPKPASTSVGPGPSASQPPQAPPSQPRRSSASRVRTPGSRLRDEDLIADLFEAMGDLFFLRDAIEAGDFCLTQIMERLPCHLGLVHLYDIDRREFVITNGQGTGARELLLRRHPESEALLSKAMRGRSALIIDASRSEPPTVARFQALGPVKSIVVAPATQSGRFLGAIELFNPLDGLPFTELEGNAVMYVAEQLAEYVATHGVVTDPDRVVARRPA